MGFMEDCHRIGYGGGFYDRTIEQIRTLYNGKMLMIGVAFEAQKFDKFTGKMADQDIWQENQNTKIAKMRAKFEGSSHVKWV
jgi:5-formyltetrahydrofolate cyclo-ligase